MDQVLQAGHHGGAETARDGDRDDPGEHDVTEDFPVYVFPGAESTDTHDGADLTMRGADGDADVRGHQYGRCGADLNTEATTRAMEKGNIKLA